jgi:hypothetical protein
MLTPSTGFCGTPLSAEGVSDAAGFQDCREDVDDVVELGAYVALVRPGNARALLDPLKRVSMACAQPTGCWL